MADQRLDSLVQGEGLGMVRYLTHQLLGTTTYVLQAGLPLWWIA